VLQLAYQYETQENFLESLLLYLKYMHTVDHENVELMRLGNAFRRIYKAVGHSRFCQICEAADDLTDLMEEVRFLCGFGYQSLETYIPGEKYSSFQAYLNNPQALELEQIVAPESLELAQGSDSLFDVQFPEALNSGELQDFRRAYINLQSSIKKPEYLGQLAISEDIESPKNINLLLDEKIPEPDIEFQNLWEDYLQSIYGKLEDNVT
jgi:hypothetical protein